MTVLDVAAISKRFGGVQAVEDVTFQVAAGEMLALIGPNGAGKSTCFNMLNGQIQPDAGRITLNNRDITGLSPRRVWRLGVGRTFQVTATFASRLPCSPTVANSGASSAPPPPGSPMKPKYC
jgi:branched-chain amino acid transport system ATP-binding protein